MLKVPGKLGVSLASKGPHSGMVGEVAGVEGAITVN